jgi:hypothetical protein
MINSGHFIALNGRVRMCPVVRSPYLLSHNYKITYTCLWNKSGTISVFSIELVCVFHVDPKYLLNVHKINNFIT